MIPPKKPHIVFVEDELPYSKLIIAGLKQVGVTEEILHLENGTAALNSLRTYTEDQSTPQPSLFILDLRLPDLDGLEILKKIKTNKILGSVPTVILSTSDTEEDKSRANEHGADEYYTKPWDFDGLCEVLGEIRSRWLT